MRPSDIKNLRKTLGITQKQLSRVIGCSHQTVQSWEQGDRHPGEDFGERLERLRRKAVKLSKLDTGQPPAVG